MGCFKLKLVQRRHHRIQYIINRYLSPSAKSWFAVPWTTLRNKAGERRQELAWIGECDMYCYCCIKCIRRFYCLNSNWIFFPEGQHWDQGLQPTTTNNNPLSLNLGLGLARYRVKLLLIWKVFKMRCLGYILLWLFRFLHCGFLARVSRLEKWWIRIPCY